MDPAAFEANRANWDERVPIHLRSDFYDVEGFIAGKSSLQPFEPEELGDVTGLSLVHLQCHFGKDTLSWARLGARTTGLDFSGPAIEAARVLANRLKINARFVCASVYDAVDALGESFDVVYTGHGALNWLPDIDGWAAVVDTLLRPGGVLYVSEFHPVYSAMAEETLCFESDYFHRPEPFVEDAPGTYVDRTAPMDHTRTYEWNHALSEIISALLAQGLSLELFRERPYTLWQRFPFLEASAHGRYRIPAGRPQVPLMYSLRARKPLGE